MTRHFSKTIQTGWRRQKTLMNAAELGLVGGQSYGDEMSAERTQAIRPLNLASDFVTPLFQSLGVWFWVLVVSLFGTWLFGWLNWRIDLFISILAGGLWFCGSLVVNRKLLYKVERIVSVDLDGDGEIGEPTPQITDLSATVPREDGTIQILRDRFDLDPDKILDWAKDAVMGKSLSINSQSGGPKKFTRAEYESFLSSLESMKLAENLRGSQGWQLTDLGKRFFGSLISP